MAVAGWDMKVEKGCGGYGTLWVDARAGLATRLFKGLLSMDKRTVAMDEGAALGLDET